VQIQGDLGSPIFDEYSDEEKQIHFVDLRILQPMYENYESDCDGEQLCIEISHPESTKDIDQPSPEISKPACTMLECGSTNNKKSSMINNEVSL
jgi:hypothetical protein